MDNLVRVSSDSFVHLLDNHLLEFSWLEEEVLLSGYLLYEILSCNFAIHIEHIIQEFLLNALCYLLPFFLVGIVFLQGFIEPLIKT